MNNFFTKKLLKEHQLKLSEEIKSGYILYYIYDLVKRITDNLNYFICCTTFCKLY